VNPYWLEEPSPARPDTKLDGRADVAIVGAGITGCSAALRLAEAGLRVRVHDARGIAEGASGRNGGFALAGGAARYDVARDTYGAERAAAFWRWTHEALDRLAELAGDALRRTGSYRLAGDEEEREGIQLEYEALREDGFDAEWLDDVPGGAAGRFHGAISHPHDGSIQPARPSGGWRRARARREPSSTSTTRSRTSTRSTPTASSSRPTATGTASSRRSPTSCGRPAAR
jgi:glycine/D-amino acid oxidase-like deaminating enzyme